MKIDIVSDLHVDYWTEYPYIWDANKNADNLIIAGDIADNLLLVGNELKNACCIYRYVLYVDGNHESTHCCHDLNNANEYISRYMKDYKNFINLSYEDFVCPDTNWVIVGRSGWWDFKICEPEISVSKSIAKFDTCWNKEVDTETIVSNIIKKAHEDVRYLESKTSEYNDRNICVVLHTVPLKELVSDTYPSDLDLSGHYGNSEMKHVISKKNVKCCVYGHNHDAKKMIKINDKTFINNARGRPNDFNRTLYKPYTIDLNDLNCIN